MKPLTDYSLDELKLIYRILQQQLAEHSALMDSDLLQDLQRYLQDKAKQDGIDISMHADWAAWLSGGTELSGL